ncbi:MAG: type II secretion system protein GspG [bacterium]
MEIARNSSAFTLIEIMIVVVVIGMMAALVGPGAMKLLFRGRQSSTQTTLQALKGAIVEYQMDIGSIPANLEALVHNVSSSPKWRGPYLEGQKEAPKDAWDNDFIYNKPPVEYKEFGYKLYEIISHGDDDAGDDKTKWLHTGA